MMRLLLVVVFEMMCTLSLIDLADREETASQRIDLADGGANARHDTTAKASEAQRSRDRGVAVVMVK